MTLVGSARSSRKAPMQYFRMGPTPWLRTSQPASVSMGDPQFPSWISSHGKIGFRSCFSLGTADRPLRPMPAGIGLNGRSAVPKLDQLPRENRFQEHLALIPEVHVVGK